jgi:uncharacterized protein (TIGR03437 family)
MLSNSVRRTTRLFSLAASCILAASSLYAAHIGTVVAIGGHASDIALDERRGVVYVANYTANRIEVIPMPNRGAQQNSISVARQPSALALSPDNRFLLVAHLSNFEETGTPFSGLTVLDLDANTRATFTLGSNVLGVAFGNDGKALVVTTAKFIQYDPLGNSMRVLALMSDITAKTLPVEPGTFPRDIIGASVGSSRDGNWIYGTLEVAGKDDPGTEDQVVLFSYDVQRQLVAPAYWVSSPPLGPRVVSVNHDGSEFLTGWALHHQQGFELAQFPNATGRFSIGGHAFDPTGRYVYAQVDQAAPGTEPTAQSTAPTGPPTLVIADGGDRPDLNEKPNLTIRERLVLPENMSGRALVESSGDYLYAVSESGLLIVPIGRLQETPRLTASVEDVVFRGNFCNRGLMTREFTLQDPGGNDKHTDFKLSTSMPGVTLSTTSGTTPATVKVTVDLGRYASQSGTTAGLIQITSASAVNVPAPVRILVNNHEPDQRGSFYNVPGTLVDLVTDPVRNRFYVLRQDKNQLLVYDSTTYSLLKTLPTGNTPWQMAITSDNQHLIVGADNSQVAYMYRLDTLDFERYIVFPFGHYPRSIAASNNAILAAVRVAGETHVIDRVYTDGIAVQLDTLGIFKNDIDVNTMLTASPSGTYIFAVQNNGAVMLYDSNLDTFVAARKDYESLSGAYGAISDNWYVADNKVLNRSLVQVATLESGTGQSSGVVAAWNGLLLRTTAASQSMNGVIQKVDLSDGAAFPRPTRIIEAPLLANGGPTLFTRTLAPVAGGNALVSLSTSGFTVLPWNYDAAVADPHIGSVVSAADGSANVATGGLISVLGDNLSATNVATNEIPLPTALGDSCLTINGILVPMIMASPTQINGQIPVNVVGPAQMVLRTPAGVSNVFNFEVKPTAPSVFQVPVEGITGKVATVVRWTNGLISTLANPLHADDWVTIYVTGLGAVTPQVDSGKAGAMDPVSLVLLPPRVTLGGVPLEIGYAGLAPEQVGVYQINAKIPGNNVPIGMEIPLTITQADSATTVYVRVVVK